MQEFGPFILVTGLIIGIAALLWGAVLAIRGEYVRPIAFVVAGCSFLWLMWELAYV